MCLGFAYDGVALSAKIGITKTTETLSRLTCSLNFMAHVSAQTRQMLNVGDGMRSSTVKIHWPESRLRWTIQSNAISWRYKVFTPLDGSIESLHSIVIKYVATPEIEESLSSMEELEQRKLYTFDEERLANATVKFRDRLQKSNSLTFKSLCKVSKVKGD